MKAEDFRNFFLSEDPCAIPGDDARAIYGIIRQLVVCIASMRSLLIDNYDSYTYNLYQLIAEVNGEEPRTSFPTCDTPASVRPTLAMVTIGTGACRQVPLAHSLTRPLTRSLARSPALSPAHTLARSPDHPLQR